MATPPPRPTGPLPPNKVYVLRNNKWVVEDKALRPAGPLPTNKTYVYDEAKNSWRLVDSSVGPQPGEQARPQPMPSPVPAQQQRPAGGGGMAQPPASPVPPDWEQAAKEIYGGYYSIIEKFPDIKDLLLRAVSEKWSPDKFRYELRQTEWYKTTSESARAWDIQSGLDPETAKQKVKDQAASLRTTALNMGVRISDSVLNTLATDSLRWAWTAQDINEAIVLEANRNGGSQIAQGYYGQQARTGAADFGLRLSDSTISDWASRIASGQETFQSYQDFLMNSAKVLYPSLSNGLDRGLTFRDLTDPYAQQASRILEIPASQVDFTDPKWAQAFAFKDEKGNPTQMSYGEWADYLRTDPRFGWEYTDDAKNRAYTVVNRLAELFGAA
jgi:hypothetical protein